MNTTEEQYFGEWAEYNYEGRQPLNPEADRPEQIPAVVRRCGVSDIITMCGGTNWNGQYEYQLTGHLSDDKNYFVCTKSTLNDVGRNIPINELLDNFPFEYVSINGKIIYGTRER